MIRISLTAAALLSVALSVIPPRAGAAPAGHLETGSLSAIQLVQEKKKSETATQKVKRVWRNITTPNYSFCVACPALIPLSRQTCATEAKTVGDARAKCAAQHPFCAVSETAKAC
jgi:hypothetical protein